VAARFIFTPWLSPHLGSPQISFSSRSLHLGKTVMIIDFQLRKVIFKVSPQTGVIDHFPDPSRYSGKLMTLPPEAFVAPWPCFSVPNLSKTTFVKPVSQPVFRSLSPSVVLSLPEHCLSICALSLYFSPLLC